MTNDVILSKKLAKKYGSSYILPTRAPPSRAFFPRASLLLYVREVVSMRVSRALLQAAMDKIHMRGMTFMGYHGVLDAERVLGQKFVVDVTMSADMRAAGASDDIEHTVDYARAYDLVKRRVESDPVNLIEKVSADIARTLLHEFPTVEDVRVGVRKPHVAVSGVVDSLGVEIYRKRGEQF